MELSKRDKVNKFRGKYRLIHGKDVYGIELRKFGDDELITLTRVDVGYILDRCTGGDPNKTDITLRIEIPSLIEAIDTSEWLDVDMEHMKQYSENVQAIEIVGNNNTLQGTLRDMFNAVIIGKKYTANVPVQLRIAEEPRKQYLHNRARTITFINFKVENIDDIQRIMQTCDALKETNIGELNLHNVRHHEDCFSKSQSLSKHEVFKQDQLSLNTFENYFKNSKQLKGIDMSKYLITHDGSESSKEYQLLKAFQGCSKLETVLNIQEAYQGKPLNMIETFQNCVALKTVEGLEKCKINQLWQTFAVCGIDSIPKINTDELTDLVETFKYSGIKQVVLKDKTFLKLQGADQVFQNCYELESVYIENITFKQLELAQNIFTYCNNLKKIEIRHVIVESDDPTNIIDFDGIIQNCDNLEEIIIDDVEIKARARLTRFGKACGNLKTIKITNVRIKGLAGSRQILSDCPSLENIDIHISGWNSEKQNRNSDFMRLLYNQITEKNIDKILDIYCKLLTYCPSLLTELINRNDIKIRKNRLNIIEALIKQAAKHNIEIYIDESTKVVKIINHDTNGVEYVDIGKK